MDLEKISHLCYFVSATSTFMFVCLMCLKYKTERDELRKELNLFTEGLHHEEPNF